MSARADEASRMVERVVGMAIGRLLNLDAEIEVMFHPPFERGKESSAGIRQTDGVK